MKKNRTASIVAACVIGLSVNAQVQLLSATQFTYQSRTAKFDLQEKAWYLADYSSITKIASDESIEWTLQLPNSINSPVLHLAGTDLYASGSNQLLKVNSDGQVIWTRDVAGEPHVAPSGAIYLSGSFRQSMDFDPGPATFVMDPLGPEDVFIVKLDAQGNFLWARQFMVGYNEAYIRRPELCIASDESIYLAGNFSDKASFTSSTGTKELVAAGPLCLYLCKLTSDGECSMAKSISSERHLYIYGFDIDASDHLTLLGMFMDAVQLDPSGQHAELESTGTFVGRYDNEINLLWCGRMGAESAGHCAIDAQTVDAVGNVYLMGRFSGTVDLDPGIGSHLFSHTSASDVTSEHGIFLARINNSGNLTAAASGGSCSPYYIASDINYDGEGKLYAGGYFTGSLDIDLGQNSTIMTTPPLYYGEYIYNTALSVYTIGDEALFVEEDTKATLSVYPNPTSGVFKISSDAGNKLEIYDTSGNMVYRTSSAGREQEVELPQLADGIYFLRDHSKELTKTAKIIVQQKRQ